MNRYITLRIAGLAIALSISSSMFCQKSEVLDQVRRLGTGDDARQIIAQLSRTPDSAARLLVEELHPVMATRILNEDADPEVAHVLWCIRALRFLNGGSDFCGRTNHVFGKTELERNRQYWLYFNNKDCAAFFAVWPSRGSVYLAPLDAQKEIIRKWRDWAGEKGRVYRPLTNPDPAQWLW